MLRGIIILATLLLFSPRLSVAQQAIFLVRHAETVAPKGTDARPLSETGKQRAEVLAKLLKDAGIKAIFTSGLERTIRTADRTASPSASGRRGVICIIWTRMQQSSEKSPESFCTAEF